MAGRGRASSLLEMLKKKQAESQVGSAPPQQPEQQPQEAQKPAESVSQASAPPMSAPVRSKGRGNLLKLVKNIQTTEVAPAPPIQPPAPLIQPPAPSIQPPAPSPSIPPSESPILSGAGPSSHTSQSAGRASLLSFVQKLSDPGTSPTAPVAKPEPLKPTASGDGGGVLGRLSLLAVDDPSSIAESKPISRQGCSGASVEITANYIDIEVQAGKGIFRYEVKFAPEIDSIMLRRKLLNQHGAALGTNRTFDGVLLYLPMKLPDQRTTYQSQHPADASVVTITVIFQRHQKLSESIPFFNILLGRVMRSLELVRIGRNDYNPRCAHAVPQHRLELWPGYVTAIDEYEGGLKLNINASHRVMRTDTVRDYINEIYQRNRQNFREVVTAEILGLTVLTRYNNRTYRIDDVEWNKSPKMSFERKGENIVVADYYKTHWNIKIKDMDQPLLMHRYKNKLPSGDTKEEQLLLVPELCYLSGLTDNIRNDFRIMRDLAKVTQVGPEARRNVILRFVQDVKNNPVALETLSGWGLKLGNDTIRLTGRELEPETIYFANNKTFRSDKADWGGATTKNPMLRTPHMRNWCILSTEKDVRVGTEFVTMLRQVSRAMGMEVTEPNYIKLRNDRTENYLGEIRKVVNPNLEMVVAICPTNRNDRYAAIKKLCCVEQPIRSQVIVTKTISRSDKLKSITEKIALQLNCKLGGALWALKIPFNNCMICGVDVYHAGPGEKSKGSVAAFVASLDQPLTSWYSRICLQRTNQEIVDLLKVCLVASVKEYGKRNGEWPQRIIVYRDGVGDGQLDTVAGYEVKQLQEALAYLAPDYKPKLTIIVVQKRINTRLMAVLRGKLQNPQPGTVVDAVVTRRNWYDFFLVPQTSRQGTVSPTHYIVVHDDADMKTDHVQRLSYKLCHLYYNWPGTVKVPAPCQYAHKLAYLVGQSVGIEPCLSLADTLYYL